MYIDLLKEKAKLPDHIAQIQREILQVQSAINDIETEINSLLNDPSPKAEAKTIRAIESKKLLLERLQVLQDNEATALDRFEKIDLEIIGLYWKSLDKTRELFQNRLKHLAEQFCKEYDLMAKFLIPEMKIDDPTLPNLTFREYLQRIIEEKALLIAGNMTPSEQEEQNERVLNGLTAYINTLPNE